LRCNHVTVEIAPRSVPPQFAVSSVDTVSVEWRLPSCKTNEPV
jgi:hypothetical protein